MAFRGRPAQLAPIELGEELVRLLTDKIEKFALPGAWLRCASFPGERQNRVEFEFGNGAGGVEGYWRWGEGKILRVCGEIWRGLVHPIFQPRNA